MRLPEPFKRAYHKLGFPGTAFVVCVALALLPWSADKFFTFLATIFGFWFGLRLIKKFTHKAIWRLRNRLLVTYTFIAVVPVLLLLSLAAVCAYALMSQFTGHLVTTEINRRLEALTSAADTLRVMDRASREDSLERMVDLFFKDRFQGIRVQVRENGKVLRYPTDPSMDLPPPSAEWQDASGLLLRDKHFFGWAFRRIPGGDITVSAPFGPEYLASIMPELGVVQIFSYEGTEQELSLRGLGPAAHYFDVPILWFADAPLFDWTKPNRKTRLIFQVQSRPSRVFALLFAQGADSLQGAVPMVLMVIAILFLAVVVIALMIGVSMTHTITAAMHRLHEGTKRVMQGDFTHRIQIKGADQLAELGASFNQMTENVQRLLSVAKEKERLQSEIEIAREVQNQLYPKLAQQVSLLRVKALCNPARMVSGDYYDYGPVKGDHVALAIGDVAGKGISAALLMASIQSAFRTHLTTFESSDASTVFSPAALVTQLNLHICKNTSPEKYLTFFVGLYDSVSHNLLYTNAGHLPPLLFRNGEAKPLSTDGTVVGAFPFSEYEQSSIALERGDLLVCFTDGITEPENAYGEMFGEERLIEIITRNLHKPDDQMLEAVIESVLSWTGSPELQDDMTILLARRD